MEQEDKNYFFKNSNIDVNQAAKILEKTLEGYDDGEIYLQYSQSENISIVDRVIKACSFDIDQGFGMRGVIGEACGFAHSNVIDRNSIEDAASAVKGISTYAKSFNNFTMPSNLKKLNLYSKVNPIHEHEFNKKIDLLVETDEYLRSKNSLVKQVSVSIGSSFKKIQIIRDSNFIVEDSRPIIQGRVMVIVEKNGRSESGFYGFGGRGSALELYTLEQFKYAADQALNQAITNLEAVESPAGESIVVLGPGYPGILLHEAVGHGLEGDANRKKTSVFSELMGKVVAAKGVTVIDDGTMPGRRGSLNFDDEGTTCQKNVLIEDGILVGYLQDRLNGRLMGLSSTGNGRRQSYCHMPIPRMTNTIMLAGNSNPSDIIADVKKGVYAKAFGGGQVDTTSGKFVFNTTECYLIENGKITSPLKGVTLIGNGADVLTKITAIGNDLELDTGLGVCGKQGQSVPVGVGQPTVRVDGITVGGAKI